MERGPQPEWKTSPNLPGILPVFELKLCILRNPPPTSRVNWTLVTLSTWVKHQASLHVLSYFLHMMYLTGGLKRETGRVQPNLATPALPESSASDSPVLLLKWFREGHKWGGQWWLQDWWADRHFRIPVFMNTLQHWLHLWWMLWSFGLSLLTPWETQMLLIVSHLVLSNLRKI